MPWPKRNISSKRSKNYPFGWLRNNYSSRRKRPMRASVKTSPSGGFATTTARGFAPMRASVTTHNSTQLNSEKLINSTHNSTHLRSMQRKLHRVVTRAGKMRGYSTQLNSAELTAQLHSTQLRSTRLNSTRGSTPLTSNQLATQRISTQHNSAQINATYN